MPVVFRCFYCRGKLSIARRKAGHDVTCPRCQAVITVPVPEDLGDQLTELLTVGSHHAAAPARPEPQPVQTDYQHDAAFDGGDVVLPHPPTPKPKPAPKKQPMSARSANDLPLFEADEIEQLLASKVGPESRCGRGPRARVGVGSRGMCEA